MPDLQSLKTTVRYYSSFLGPDLAKVYLQGRNTTDHAVMIHVDAAVQWICRAQDAFADGGVARSYSLVYNPYFQRRGWVPSYPETTGYIIPTMFDYARLAARQDIFDRAVRMADWECDAQMENGAVQGGTIDQPPTPAIFNTGQVIFGWVRAFQETGNFPAFMATTGFRGVTSFKARNRDRGSSCPSMKRRIQRVSVSSAR